MATDSEPPACVIFPVPRMRVRLCLGRRVARVNMEDSLITDGHLHKLSRAMKWKPRAAAGALWFVYRSTQKAGIVTASIDTLVTCTVLDFDSDEEAVQFLAAMCTAQLAERLSDGQVRIIGNEKHVERIAKLHGNAKKGGEARQKQMRENLNIGEATSLANAKPELSKTQADRSAPSSLLLSPSSSASAGAGASEGKTPPVEQAREQASKEFDDRPRLVPMTDSLKEINESQVPVAHAVSVARKHQAELKKRGILSAREPLPGEISSARRVIVQCAGNHELAMQIVEAYVSDKTNDFWKKLNWPISLLAKPDDFEKAKLMAGKKMGDIAKGVSR